MDWVLGHPAVVLSYQISRNDAGLFQSIALSGRGMGQKAGNGQDLHCLFTRTHQSTAELGPSRSRNAQPWWQSMCND